MSLILAGFVLAAGALVASALVKFWDSIRNWLNTVAADAVERNLGYSARNTMQKAVAIIDRTMDKLKNRSVIYTKKNPSDTYFDKTTIMSEARVANMDDDILMEIEKNGNHITQTFTYQA